MSGVAGCVQDNNCYAFATKFLNRARCSKFPATTICFLGLVFIAGGVLTRIPSGGGFYNLTSPRMLSQHIHRCCLNTSGFAWPDQR